MDKKPFRVPDESTIARMNPASLKSLLSTLRQQRAAKVKPLDEEIKYYEGLLEAKEQERAKAAS